jgi:GH25 family lysozyme M1 (1,4-beta-N-acetylmuramidase)
VTDIAPELAAAPEQTAAPAAAKPVPTIRGIDVSSWQHPDGHPIDWPKVRAAGIRFAILKATQGASDRSNWFKVDARGAAAAGILVGAYHYYDQSGTSEEQANNFLAATQGVQLPMGAWLDWECPESMASNVYNTYVTYLPMIAKVRGLCGTYCDESWLPLIKQGGGTIDRLWLTTLSKDWPAVDCFIWQTVPGEVDGIEGQVDIDVLLKPRGINLPSVPSQDLPSSWESATKTTGANTSNTYKLPHPPTLQLGSEGSPVLTLQALLNQHLHSCLALDSTFGPETEDAVKTWQAGHDLQVDGICGPLTWDSLVKTT